MIVEILSDSPTILSWVKFFPKEIRTVFSASCSSIPISLRVSEAFTEPDEHAEPPDIAYPCISSAITRSWLEISWKVMFRIP